MANVTITQLPAAGPIQGDELVPIVQNGQTVRTTTAAVAGSPVQTQTFITLNQEPTLNNSRALAGGTGVGLVDNGAQSTLQVTLNGASGSLESAGNGVIVKTGASTVTNRSIAVSGTGLAITNGDGVSGNPTVALDGLISAVAQVGGTGLLAIQNGTTAGGVLIAGTAAQIDVADGDGQGGNPTISISDNPIIPGTGGMRVPGGTTAQQPPGANGTIRYNSDTGLFEGFSAGSWTPFSVGGGVISFSAGSTGLTPSVSTVGAVTLGGTLNVANGGTGATSLTGYLVGNGTSAITTVATIPNAGLTNSAVTYNGVTVALGSSGTITAASPQALTIGTGLSGGSYNGSSAVTVAIDSTVATLTGTQTLTNKSISGATNTLSSIPNAALDNSSVTIGTTNVSLGGTSLTLGGLTSVAVTQDPVSALQVATKQYVDTLVSSGITYHAPVKYEVPSTTGNLNATYNNGVSGVGATLTNAGTLAAFAPDGPTASPGDRVLIYNQTNAFENGVYTVTVVGDGSTAWVLTRATDADTYGLKSPTSLGDGDAFFVQSGNTGAGETYVCNTTGVITFGTTAITFAQVSASQVYSAGTGLTLSGTQFSLTVPVAATNGGTGLTSFTANGIPYANSTTTLTTGSALTFDGTTLGVSSGSSTPALKLYGAAVSQGQLQFSSTSGYVIQGGPDYTGLVYNVGSASYQHIWQINGSEQMRLTSTGLGIGTSSPASGYLLTVGSGTASTNGTVALNGGSDSNYGSGIAFRRAGVSKGFIGTQSWVTSGTSDDITLYASASGALRFYSNGAQNAILDSSGNLGLGVTPSAWASNWKAFQIGSRSLAQTGSGAGDWTMAFNAVFDSTDSRWEYQYTGDSAVRYSQTGAGIHAWYTAASGNAGDPISFAQAMTLTSLGNLLVNTTSDDNSKVRIKNFYSFGSKNTHIFIDGGDISNTGVVVSGGYISQDVIGGIRLEQGGTYYGAGLSQTDSVSTTYSSAGFNDGNIRFFTNTGLTASTTFTPTERMRLDASGNLGIGTSSPSSAYSGSARVAMVAATGTNVASLRVSSANASAELYSAGSITEWGLYSASNSPFSIWTNNNKNLTLDSSGNLGLGVTPSAWTTTAGISALQVSSRAALWGDTTQTILSNNMYASSTGDRYIATANASLYTQISGQHRWLTAASGNAGDPITFTQAMTLDASGKLLLGTTSLVANEQFTMFGAYAAFANASYTAYLGAAASILNSGSASDFAIRSNNNLVFSAGGATERARITSGGDLLVGKTSTSVSVSGAVALNTGAVGSSIATGNDTFFVYNTTAAAYRFYVTDAGTVFATNTTISAISDQRFKENVRDLDVGLNAIMALKPRKFDWKAGKGKDIKNDRGFVAQEFEQVFPDLIDEWKDPAPEGEEPYKSVRADLIPILVKAIQELKAEFDAYKATHP